MGCLKRYKHTTKVCNNSLYVEVYNINPAGVDADYLTDSINFKLYVGSWDNEHEHFAYECKSDSIFIEKLDVSEAKFRVLEKKAYSLQELKQKKMFE